MTTAPMERDVPGANRLSDLTRSIFSTVGILPILLAVVILYFASQESRFYGTANLTNVLRQSRSRSRSARASVFRMAPGESTRAENG